MIRRRTIVNLITVIIASTVLALYALTQLVAGAVFGQGYPLFLEMPEAGGLTENKQVTYRGLGVGHIADVELFEDGVLFELEIDPDARIPRGVQVVVLRQSAVGEQALDFRPIEPEGPDTEYYEEMETIPLDDVLGDPVLPTKPEDLLVLANDVFGGVNTENTATLISELADAVRGRTEDLRSINVDAAILSESVADNGAEYDRLFSASRVVNASLAENREILAQLLTDFADSVELIGEIRGDVDGLLDTVPPVLSATTSVLARGDANLACVIEDLADLNEFISLPTNLENLAETIRTQVYFFDAFRIIGPTSAQEDPWLRVHLISQPEPVPNRYEPKRPIPDTLPGGACESVFGPGAGAAFQDTHQLAVPQGQVVRPANDRRTSFGVAGTQPALTGFASRLPLPADAATEVPSEQ